MTHVTLVTHVRLVSLVRFVSLVSFVILLSALILFLLCYSNILTGQDCQTCIGEDLRLLCSLEYHHSIAG